MPVAANATGLLYEALICLQLLPPAHWDNCRSTVVRGGRFELAFTTPVRCYGRAGWLGWKPKVFNHTTAIFRQVNKDIAWTHHDSLEFPDGQRVLLTDVFEGQEATVLQLPAQPVTAADTKAQERVSYVG